jgi:tetratricopeptide (TPR) repeat protein
LDDRSVDVHRNYAYVLEMQGNYWGAMEAYERALEIHPNLAYIHIAVGKNYAALGDFDAAMRSFERATEIDPNNAEAYYILGRAYYDSGDYDQAETYLKRAIEADPKFGPAFGHLAFTYWSRRNYEEAIKNLEPAIELELVAARQDARAFYVTIEYRGSDVTEPSVDVVMHGDFVPASASSRDTLQAALVPQEDDETWANARGTVTFDTRTAKYTVDLEGLPRLRYDQIYVGWFEGVNALSGDPLGTGSLQLETDGSVAVELEAEWVEGPAIDYLYTLGLAYFYMAECEKSYPLFDAVLQMSPGEPNALEGIRLCQEAE